MTYVLTTFAFSEEPSLAYVDDGQDDVLWADEINGGWGLSNDQEARRDGSECIEHNGFLVCFIGTIKTTTGAEGLVRAWNEALKP